MADWLEVSFEFQPRLVIFAKLLANATRLGLERLQPVGLEPLGDGGVAVAAHRHPLALRLIQENLNICLVECGHGCPFRREEPLIYIRGYAYASNRVPDRANSRTGITVTLVHRRL